MVVDPHWSGNKPCQESNHSTQTAGNRPHLQKAQVLHKWHKKNIYQSTHCLTQFYCFSIQWKQFELTEIFKTQNKKLCLSLVLIVLPFQLTDQKLEVTGEKAKVCSDLPRPVPVQRYREGSHPGSHHCARHCDLQAGVPHRHGSENKRCSRALSSGKLERHLDHVTGAQRAGEDESEGGVPMATEHPDPGLDIRTQDAETPQGGEGGQQYGQRERLQGWPAAQEMGYYTVLAICCKSRKNIFTEA